MKRTPKKSKSIDWKANEPLSAYLTSKEYFNKPGTITVSSFKEQEESNYEYWKQLTPGQRLELHYWLISGAFNLRKKEDQVEDSFSIIITENGSGSK